MRQIFIKIFLFLTFVNSLCAEISIERKNLFDALLNKTNSIATAHIGLIEDRGTLSTNIASLITLNYLDSNFVNDNMFGQTITYTSNNTALDIDTNLDTTTLGIDEKAYILNQYIDARYGRVIYEKSNNIYVMYFYTSKAISNLLNNSGLNTYLGNAEPSSYTTVSANQVWWDSNDVSFNVKKYAGSSWVNDDYGNQYLASNGSFYNQNTINISKSSWIFSNVTSTEIITSIICDVGSNYNPILQRCEAYTSNACPVGTIFNTTTRKCDLGDNSACLNVDGVWNGSTCTTTTTYNATLSIDTTMPSYSDCPTSTMSMADAKNYCTSLTQGGFSDWRVPTESLGDGFYISYRTGGTVPSCSAGWTWSQGKHSDVWSGKSFAGSVGGNYNVRCMRGKGTIFYHYSEASSYSCPSGGTLGGNICTKTVNVSPTCSSGFSHDGKGRCAVNTNCTGKKMSVSPFSPTTYNGNNGLCYSDAGLYCKVTNGLSYDGAYTCYKTNQSCQSGYSLYYNYSGSNDKCAKYNYSCSNGNLYGLNTNTSNVSVSTLYSRIANKDAKANAYASSFLTNNNVIVNDNLGAMCVDLNISTLTQSAVAPSYTINSISKSGF